MPPKRKAPTRGASKAPKKSRKSEDNGDNSSESGDDNENEDRTGDEEDGEELDEDDLIDKYNEGLKAKDNNALKPAHDFPNHRWIAMWETWKLFCDYHQRAAFTCPDMFGMYFHNDFNGYGLQELIENMMIAFDVEFAKKNRDEKSSKQMWAVSAATGHWLVTEELGPWMMLEDGERMISTIKLIGCAFISALDELDSAGFLKADSALKDLGLVMSLYLEWGSTLEDYGEDELSWRKEVVAYARRANIDLEATGCYGIAANVEALDNEHGEIKPISSSTKADRWGWKKTFKGIKDDCGKLGGEQYNILKFSRKERAKHAFDGKDPLQHIPEKDLRAGNIGLA